MPDRQIEMTERAEQALTEMNDTLRNIQNGFGRSSDEYIDALESAYHSICQVLRLGGRISRDGEAALFGSSFIQYGVIFHRTHDNGQPRESGGATAGTWSVHS